MRLISFDEKKILSEEQILLAPHSEGSYSWWGTEYAWAPDGSRVVYASYRDDAVELRLLDVNSLVDDPLVVNGAVNGAERYMRSTSRPFTSSMAGCRSGRPTVER